MKQVWTLMEEREEEEEEVTTMKMQTSLQV
jgi:hypothetical protein